MKGIDLLNAEVGTVSSRPDGSVAFRVITGELRPSEAGAVLQYHGKACRVTILPHDSVPEEVVSVDTEREGKSPSARLRAVLFVLWKHEGEQGDFEDFYRKRVNLLIDKIKAKLP